MPKGLVLCRANNVHVSPSHRRHLARIDDEDALDPCDEEKDAARGVEGRRDVGEICAAVHSCSAVQTACSALVLTPASCTFADVQVSILAVVKTANLAWQLLLRKPFLIGEAQWTKVGSSETAPQLVEQLRVGISAHSPFGQVEAGAPTC